MKTPSLRRSTLGSYTNSRGTLLSDETAKSQANRKEREMSKIQAQHRQPWTAAEKQELRQLARGNTPTRVIAIKLNRTPGAVQDQAGKQHTSLKPTNQAPYNRRNK